MSLSLRRWCERAEFIPISCVGILHSPTEVYQHRNLKCHGFLVVGKAIFLKLSKSIRAVSCESGFWTIEKWKVKKKGHSLFLRSASEKKGLCIEIEKWKWNKNDWISRSRSESEMKKLRDRDQEVKFLENFREFKKDRFWSIGKGAFGGYIISLCNLLDQREGGGGRCLRLGWNGGGWDEGSEVGATEREEYYEDLEDEHSDEEGEDDWFLISLTIK